MDKRCIILSIGLMLSIFSAYAMDFSFVDDPSPIPTTIPKTTTSTPTSISTTTTISLELKDYKEACHYAWQGKEDGYYNLTCPSFWVTFKYQIREKDDSVSSVSQVLEKSPLSSFIGKWGISLMKLAEDEIVKINSVEIVVLQSEGITADEVEFDTKNNRVIMKGEIVADYSQMVNDGYILEFQKSDPWMTMTNVVRDDKIDISF